MSFSTVSSLTCRAYRRRAPRGRHQRDLAARHAQIARDAGWVSDDDMPEKWRVQRAIASLADDKLIQQVRKGVPWTLTEKGEKAINKDNL